MLVEIQSLERLREILQCADSLDRILVQGLDLEGETDRLCTVDAAGATFLGCRFERRALAHVVATGGLVFPELPDLPFRPYRPRLYTVQELMEGFSRGVPGSFRRSVDTAIYEHFQRFRDDPPVLEALAQRLHDHAIDDALRELLEDKEVVAIMGGHGLRREQPEFAAVVEIARALARAGLFVATGGGPGAMEAGNLGAWLAPYPDEAASEAIEILRGESDYREHRYLELGFQVRDRFPEGGESLAIPTWFYGHEPTNHFSAHVAKYFSNSLREDGLLAIATRGVIYAPGSAGTVQEVFMDACQNHYGTFRVVSPMVFFGVEFWREKLPAEPLLRTLAGRKQYADLVAISDDPNEVVRFVLDHPPVPYQG